MHHPADAASTWSTNGSSEHLDLENKETKPEWGSRSVDIFQKLEQIGEGTYGYDQEALWVNDDDE